MKALSILFLSLVISQAQIVTPAGAAIGTSIPSSCSAGSAGLFVQRDVANDLVTMSACVNGQYQVFWRALHYADAEVPGGAMVAQNRTFALRNAPMPASSLLLVLNGLVLKPGGDYTLKGNVITFQLTAAAPTASSDLLQAWYRY